MKKQLLLFILLVSFHSASADTALFAGGCFWCMEVPFDSLMGVISAKSGYTGGLKVNPTYEEVSSGTTGHREAVEVTYNPKIVTYAQLLKVFWENIDPIDKDGQFCDKGEQYTSAVFTNNEAEKKAFELSKPKGLGIIATKLLPAGAFYPAEEYHQDYSKKNPIRYKFYRYKCGRDKRLKEIWGKSTH
jgi:peptide-methionine (S)-S-oxide reductase